MMSIRKVYSLLIFLFLNYQLTLSSVDVTITPIDESVPSRSFPPTEMPKLPSTDKLPKSEFSSTSSPSAHTTTDILNGKRKDEASQTDNAAVIMDSIPNECNGTGKHLLWVPAISNCSNFYEICTNQETITQTDQLSSNLTTLKSCTNGTFFDSISAQCTEKSNAYCGPYKCAKPDGFFHDKTSRNNFIHCVDGVPYRKSCEPNGTVFVNESKVCMWAPENLAISLRFFKSLMWFIKFTEPTLSPGHPYLNSKDGYIKIGIVAVLIPVLYILAIVVWYKQFYRPERNRRGTSRYSSNAEDFHHCYYRRPSRNSGMADFRPMTQQPTNNPSNDSYFVTSSF